MDTQTTQTLWSKLGDLSFNLVEGHEDLHVISECWAVAEVDAKANGRSGARAG